MQNFTFALNIPKQVSGTVAVSFNVDDPYWLAPGMETITDLGMPSNPAVLYKQGAAICPLSLAVGFGEVKITRLTWHCYSIGASGYVAGWDMPLIIKVYSFCSVVADGVPDESDVSGVRVDIPNGKACGTEDCKIAAGQTNSSRNLAISLVPKSFTNADAAYYISITLYGTVTIASP